MFGNSRSHRPSGRIFEAGPAARLALTGGAALGLLLATGCQRLLNGPQKEDEDQIRPDKIVNFDTLYGQNCAGCHGADGKNGPAIPMNNPEYMAIATDDQIRTVTANGQSGTLMPAFAQSAGGLLTDEQINVIVSGMRQRWGKPMPGLNPPPYAAHISGDVAHGESVYTSACASCHGPANQGSAGAQGGASAAGGAQAQPGGATSAGKAGSIIDPTFLALLGDQSLRTIVIAGRPDLGQPDWRGDMPGHPLTDQEITDVVAWLSSHRAPLPGQPHPGNDAANPGSGAANPAATESQRRVQ
jgi:cytochrome c oxidase cbb3-type subunit 3/ubiquinol-cytochrome c reductase cytochrome c subunit